MTETTITRLNPEKFGNSEPFRLPKHAKRKPVLQDAPMPRSHDADLPDFSANFDPFRGKESPKDEAQPTTECEPQKDIDPVKGALTPSEPEEAEFEAIETADVASLGSREATPIVETETITAEPAMAAHAPEPRFSLRARIAALCAVIALPAMAAPGDFGAEPGRAPTKAEMAAASNLTTQQSMPFEQAGMSFPGSAFFYLADPPNEALVALPNADPLTVGTFDGLELGEYIDAGPAANRFFLAGESLSKGRAQQCLSQAIWYEAASESDAGQRAVAQVVLNRVKHPSWPNSVCGVVYQGSQRRTGCQFTFTCDGSLARRPSGGSWSRAQLVASSALGGQVYAPIGMATHYHTLWVNPYWSKSLDHVGTIGAHIFYRNRGAAGQKAAFTGRYSGSEPKVRGRTTAPPAGTPRGSVTAPLPDFSNIPSPRTPRASRQADPGRSSRSSGTSRGAAVDQAPTGSPIANPELRSAGQVKEKYSNAGQWKKRPDKDSDAAGKDPK